MLAWSMQKFKTIFLFVAFQEILFLLANYLAPPRYASWLVEIYEIVTLLKISIRNRKGLLAFVHKH